MADLLLILARQFAWDKDRAMADSGMLGFVIGALETMQTNDALNQETHAEIVMLVKKLRGYGMG